MNNHYLAQQLVRIPRPFKRLLALFTDALLCVVTVWLALCLRLEHWVVLQPAHWVAVLVAVVLSAPIFLSYGLYASIFRFAGWQAMLALTRAMLAYSLAYIAIFTVIGINGVPRTVGVIQPLLLFVGVGASRVLVRFFLGDLYRSILSKRKATGVMIYGVALQGASWHRPWAIRTSNACWALLTTIRTCRGAGSTPCRCMHRQTCPGCSKSCRLPMCCWPFRR